MIFLVCSANLYLLIGEFKPCTFKVVIDKKGLTSLNIMFEIIHRLIYL